VPISLRNALSRNKEFLGHVATLMTGKGLAGLIAILTMPIVARLFNPDEFGIAAMYLAIVNLVGAEAGLRYEQGIALPPSDEEAITIMALAYRILAFVCGACLILIAVYEASGLSWDALELLGGWIWLLPLGVLLSATLRIQESWLTRTKSFKRMSASMVVGNASTGISRIAFGALMGSTVFGLVMGLLIGIVSRIAMQMSACAMPVRRALASGHSTKLRDVARRYSDFPLYSMPAGFVYSVGQNLPFVLFGVMFSPAVVGLYAMARQLLYPPVRMVADSVRRVFFQKIAQMAGRGRSLQQAFLLATGALAVLGLPPLLIIMIFGQDLIAWFLGDRWSQAGLYAEIIAPWVFMVLLMGPSGSIFVVLREQRLFLVIQTAHTILRIGSFGIAYILGAGPESTLQGFVAVTVAGNLVIIFIAMLLSRRLPGGDGADQREKSNK
jgi:O-antigen/teichoic acid export membrane protein